MKAPKPSDPHEAPCPPAGVGQTDILISHKKNQEEYTQIMVFAKKYFSDKEVMPQ